MRICFVGDSFVNGTGDPDCLGWAGRVCAASQHDGHDVTYYNLGVRRETSADIRGRWEREVSCRLPEGSDGRVVFSFGVNDTTLEGDSPRVDFSDSIENARQVLDLASQSYPTLMIGPPPTSDADQNTRIARLSDGFAPVCGELGIPYLDVFASLQASGVWTSEAAANDGAHPRAGGYSEMAQLVQVWPGWLSWFTIK